MNTQRVEIDDSLLTLLGKIVVKWSYLEMMVSDLFVHLSKGEAAAMVVVTSNASQSSISGWIRTLLDLLEELPQCESDAREVLSEIDALRADRNALVHGHWTPNERGHSALVHTAKLERREVLKSELVTLQDLGDTLARIHEITIDMVTVLRSFNVKGYG